ncbi:hypothetical protein Avbf_13581 [Armadillidium vulgare]|nr:hypothetical protein Avbf_13581 [Armadillidium vulgare]
MVATAFNTEGNHGIQSARFDQLRLSETQLKNHNLSSKIMKEIFEERSSHLKKMCTLLYFDPKPYIVFGEVNNSYCIPGRKEYGYAECTFTTSFVLARFSSTMFCAINKVELLKPDQSSLLEFREYLKIKIKILKRIPLNKKENEFQENFLKGETKKEFKEPVDSLVPTFEDFLFFILSTEINGDGFETHWIPYWKRCSPCSFPYDLIVKLDSGYSELEYVWPVLGFNSTVVPWTGKTIDKISEEKILKKFYSFLVLKDYYESLSFISARF